MIFKLFRKETELEKTANKLYEAIVAQARQPEFYRDHHVSDSINGRFEMIVLHAYMLFRRLRKEDAQTRALGQATFDRFFRDMDDQLRQIGVGDLSVPKKIKKMAQAFYGRVEAYDTARDESKESLVMALSRNIFPDDPAPCPGAAMLADYVLQSGIHLDGLDAQAFHDAKLSFAAIPPVKSEA